MGIRIAKVLAFGRGLFPTYLSHGLPEPLLEISIQRTIPPFFIENFLNLDKKTVDVPSNK
jgi:hypothetical protein